MSSSADASLVQQKKTDTDLVNCAEYTALRSHLSREFGNRCDQLGSDLAATDAKIDKMQETLDFLTRSMQTLTQRHAQPADDASVLGEDEADFAEEASFTDGAATLLPINRDREHRAARPVQLNLRRNTAPGLLLGGVAKARCCHTSWSWCWQS